jgi:hypothetical protein
MQKAMMSWPSGYDRGNKDSIQNVGWETSWKMSTCKTKMVLMFFHNEVTSEHTVRKFVSFSSLSFRYSYISFMAFSKLKIKAMVTLQISLFGKIMTNKEKGKTCNDRKWNSFVLPSCHCILMDNSTMT